MSDRFTAACIQFTASREPAVNRAALDHLIRKAKAAGADFIMTPEVSDMLEPRRAVGFAKARAEDRHETLAAMQALAADLETWLLLGSMVVRLSGERLANRSFLIGPDGGVRARYDKIHMFDTTILRPAPPAGARHRRITHLNQIVFPESGPRLFANGTDPLNRRRFGDLHH